MQMQTAMMHIRGTSWLHQLSPIAKLAWLVAIMCFAFASYNPVPLFAIALAGLVMAVSAGLLRPILKILLVFTPVTASMLVIQAIAPAICSDDCTPATTLGPLVIYQEGISHGLSLTARVLSMEIIAILALITTNPADLFSAFARLRVPYMLNFMVSMTLQLIPVLQREVQIVLSAQRSRGMKSHGFGSVVPSFVPVFAGAFERVQQLSISLESRAFGSSQQRTSYRRVRFGPVDLAVAVTGLTVGLVGTVVGLIWWSADNTPVIVLPVWLTVAIFLVAAVMFVGIIAAALIAIARS